MLCGRQRRDARTTRAARARACWLTSPRRRSARLVRSDGPICPLAVWRLGIRLRTRLVRCGARDSARSDRALGAARSNTARNPSGWLSSREWTGRRQLERALRLPQCRSIALCAGYRSPGRLDVSDRHRCGVGDSAARSRHDGRRCVPGQRSPRARADIRPLARQRNGHGRGTSFARRRDTRASSHCARSRRVHVRQRCRPRARPVVCVRRERQCQWRRGSPLDFQATRDRHAVGPLANQRCLAAARRPAAQSAFQRARANQIAIGGLTFTAIRSWT